MSTRKNTSKKAAPKKSAAKAPKAPTTKSGHVATSDEAAKRADISQGLTEKENKEFEKGHKQLSSNDYVQGMSYVVRQGNGAPVSVEATGNLSQDATKFHDHAVRGEAYSSAATSKAKAKKNEFPKQSMKIEDVKGTPTAYPRSIGADGVDRW